MWAQRASRAALAVQQIGIPTAQLDRRAALAVTLHGPSLWVDRQAALFIAGAQHGENRGGRC